MLTDNIDWSEVWKDLMKRHYEMNGGTDCADCWDDEEEAKNYWKMVQHDCGGYVDHLLDRIRVEPTFRVLDIGAGPGKP